LAAGYSKEKGSRSLSRIAAAAALFVGWVAPNATESAIANGDTRSVWFSNQHTNEEAKFTYMANGVYDSSVLDKLNWFMRDWRLNEPTKMDPHLFDIVWEVYRESGSRQPINVFSAYRSPQTNSMLRRRSRQVAEHSQHMAGKAIDAHFEDVGPARIRDIAMRMQEGGVGFYPQGLTWIHIDSGSVRYWPRMSRDALTRLFPDGKTVFIPADGKPMPGYDLALAEIQRRGGEIQTGGGGNLFAWLFGRGGGADDAEEGGGQEALVTATSTMLGGRGGGHGSVIAAPDAPGVEIAEAGPTAVAKAKRGLPSGQTYASAAPEPAPAPEPAHAPKPEVVAKLEQPAVESDSTPDAAPADSPVKLHGPVAAAFLAPLPPKRPSDLSFQIAALDFPLPPARPSDLAALAPPAPVSPPIRPADLPPDSTASTALPPARPSTLIASLGPASGVKSAAHSADLVTDVLHDRLPKVITQGVATPPRAALALADPSPGASAIDDGPLLARAAEIAAPLPPMPIPDIGLAAKPASPPLQKSASLTERVKGFLGGWFGRSSLSGQ
jgi:uncharacterized protein YcbK (DUF882 family)